MSSDSVDNWIVGFMTALAPGLAHLASDFQMVDTQYVLFRSAANMKRNETNIKKTGKNKKFRHTCICLRHKIKMVALKSPILVNCVLFVLLH